MRTLTFGLGLSLLLLGCAKENDVKVKSPTQAPADDANAPADTKKKKSDGNDITGQISVAPALRQLCELPTPHFAFDSANVPTESAKTFDALVKCFTTGPAKDHRLLIVGHTDSRGEDGYNRALGQRRAGSVALQLSRRGLEPNRMETSSRGEIDAEGDDEVGWASDRRVELALASSD